MRNLFLIAVFCLILFSLTTQAQATTFVVDNSSPSALGAGQWIDSSATNYYGTGSLYATTSGDLDTFTFLANFTQPGQYQVEVWNPTHSARSTAAPHTVMHDGGATLVNVDQMDLQNQWVQLGVFQFGLTGSVIISDQGVAPGTFIGADAVRFICQSDGPTNPTPSTPQSPRNTVGSKYLPAITTLLLDGNSAPTVSLGQDRQIAIAEGLTLMAGVADDGLPNDVLSYAWTKLAGPGSIQFSAPTALSTHMTFSAIGTYVIQLDVSDGVLTGNDTITVIVSTTVTNQAPVITLQEALEVQVNTQTTLRPSVQDDGVTSTPLTYSWAATPASNNVVIAQPNAIQTSISFNAPGTYQITFTASDGLLSSEKTIEVTVLAGTGGGSGIAGGAGQQTPVYRFSDQTPYGYMEYVPQGFIANGTKKWPVIIFWAGSSNLGRGGTSFQLEKLLVEPITKLIHEGRHFEAFVISPQLPSLDNSWDDKSAFLNYILDRYADHIDPSRLYVTGFSFGGGVAVLNAQRHPNLVAAVVPTGPVVNNGQMPTGGLLTVPSWFFHGTADNSVPYSRTKTFVDDLLAQGAPTQLTTVSGGDHHSAELVAYSDNAMWAWLFSQ